MADFFFKYNYLYYFDSVNLHSWEVSFFLFKFETFGLGCHTLRSLCDSLGAPIKIEVTINGQDYTSNQVKI